MAVMASDGPSPHPPSLAATHQPLRRHHAQFLLGPSFTQERRMFLNPTPSLSEPRRCRLSCCRLSLRPYTAPLSCSLQPLLKLSLLSLGPCLLQYFSVVSFLQSHRNPIFEPVCVFLPVPLLPLLF